MIQPVTTCHKGFITLHVGGGHVHQACGAVVDLRFDYSSEAKKKSQNRQASSYSHVVFFTIAIHLNDL
jgi:hypothetical protein